MPRKRRRAKARLGHVYSSGHALQLQCGHDFFNDAYGPQPDLELMRSDWEQHRDEITQASRERGTRLRPWAWWRFDRDYDEPPRGIEAEAAKLRRLGELTSEDEAALAQWRRVRGAPPNEAAA